jgi:hypothetical protein
MHSGGHGKKLPTSAPKIFFEEIGHEVGHFVKGSLNLFGKLFNPFGVVVSTLNAIKAARCNQEINNYFERIERKSGSSISVKKATGIFSHPQFKEMLTPSTNTHLEIERSHQYLLILQSIIEKKPQFAQKIEEIIPKQQREAVLGFYTDRRNLMDKKRELDNFEYQLWQKTRAHKEISHEEEHHFSRLVTEFYELQKKFLSHFSYPQDSLIVSGFGALQTRKNQLDKIIQESSKH